MNFIGRQVDVGIGKESVRGTAVVPTFFIPQVSFEFNEQIQQATDGGSVGRIEGSIDQNVTEQFVEGTLEGIIRAESFGLLLLATMGAVVSNVDSPEAGVQTHDYTVDNSAQHQSLTIGVDDPNDPKEFALAMITSLSIEAALNEYITFTADIRAKAGVTQSFTPSYTEADERKVFLPQHGTFKTAADLSGLGAAPEIKIRSFTLNIAKNVEDDQVIGNLAPDDILNKQFAVEGTVELLYDDSTFVTDLLADTAKAMRLTLANTDITIGSVTNPTLEIDLARVKFSEVSKPFTNDDLVVQTVSFTAHYDISDAAMIKVKLINETVSY